MDSFRRPGGFASPLSPTRRHLSAENCTDASCGCSVDASGTAVGAWARSRQPSPRRDAGLEVETRRVQPWCGKFELRPYVQLVAVDTEARRVAVFLFSQLAVLALELLLPALWRMDPTLLGAALRGLLRSISLALVLHAMAMKTRPPTTAYSYGFGRGEVIGGFMMGAFTLFCVLYEGVEAIQRMVDPHHREGASVITMDEEQPWALGVLGVVLNAAAAIVFRQHRMHGLSLGNFSSVEDGGFAGGGSFSRKGMRAQRTSRRGRDDLLEGVFVLAVAELSGRLAGGLGGDGWGYSLLEDCAALVAALIGGAVALPLTVRTARLLLQASPAALQHRLSRAMIEGGLLDGVVECRCPHFWEQAPGRCVGSLVVRLRRGADEQSVLRAVRDLFVEAELLAPEDLTVHVEHS